MIREKAVAFAFGPKGENLLLQEYTTVHHTKKHLLQVEWYLVYLHALTNFSNLPTAAVIFTI